MIGGISVGNVMEGNVGYSSGVGMKKVGDGISVKVGIGGTSGLPGGCVVMMTRAPWRISR
jgi:hypothetical protein